MNTNEYFVDDTIPMDDEALFEAFRDEVADSYIEMWNAKYGGTFVTRDGENVFIKKVIYHRPKVTIMWSDGTKSVASCTDVDSDHFSFEAGLNIAINNRLYGYDEMNRLYNDWLPDRYYPTKDIDINDTYEVTIADVRKHYKLAYAVEDKINKLYMENTLKQFLESCGYKVTKLKK